MEDAADAEFFGGSCDRVVDFAHTHELEHLHPIAQVMEHEDKVIVVLKGLALHLGNDFEVLCRLFILEEFADFIVHEAGEFEVKAGVTLLDRFEQAFQLALVEFGKFRESVISKQVGEFLRLGGVVLLIDGHRLTSDQQCCLKPTVAAHNLAAALGERDGIAPALLLNDGSQQLDLVGAVPVGVGRIRLERVGIGQTSVGAVNGDAHTRREVSTSLTMEVGYA